MNKQVYSGRAIKIAFFAAVLGFLGLLGSDLYLPAMPVMRIALHTSKSAIEFSVAVYMIGFGLSPLIFGPIADGFGRKRAVVPGLAIALLGASMAGFSHTIHFFLMARLIQGFGAGSTLCVFRIILRDVVDGKKMAVLASYSTMAFNLSPVIGMVVGGYVVYYFNWRVCFGILVLFYLLFILVYTLTCPETLKERRAININALVRHYIGLLRNKRFVGCAVCSGLGFSTVFAFATAGAFIVQHDLHVSAVSFGWLGLVLSLASIIGKGVNAVLVPKLALPKIMTFGMVLIAIAGMALSIPSSHCLWVAVLFMALASGSSAFILSNSMAMGMQSHAKGTGFAASLYGCIQLLTGFVTNGLLAYFAHLGIVSLSIFYLAIGLTSIMTLFLMIRERKNDSSQNIALTG